MSEIYKDIKGYEGKYQVSNFGNIKSCKRVTHGNYTQKEVIKKPNIYKGKSRTTLWNNRKRYDTSVHTLVYETFIGKVVKGNCIIHRDGDYLNNNIANLKSVPWSFVHLKSREKQVKDKCNLLTEFLTIKLSDIPNIISIPIDDAVIKYKISAKTINYIKNEYSKC